MERKSIWAALRRQGRLQKAKARINSVARKGQRALDLNNLGLKSEELERLIPEIRNKIPKLKVLTLANNKLTLIPDNISDLSLLKELDLSENRISTLPDRFASLSQLETLNLKNNKFQSFPDPVLALTNLKNILVTHNDIKVLPDRLGELSNLFHLDVSHNQLASLPSSLGRLSALEYLYLGSNRLTTLPTETEQLFGLKELTISNNELHSLPNTIGNLSELVRLVASNNQIKALPKGIVLLSKLQNLDLSENQLETLPKSFGVLDKDIDINVLNNQDLNVRAVRAWAQNFPHLSSEHRKSALEDRISKIIGRELDQFPQKIREFGRYQVGEKICSVEAVLQEFLDKIPLDKEHSNTVYVPAAVSILETIFCHSNSLEERQNAMLQIATALGDCTTPVNSFLTQKYIGMQMETEKELPALAHQLICAMAIEQAVIKKFKLGGTYEGIEKVQALRNSLFDPGSENHALNKVPIVGDRLRLDSLSAYAATGYDKIDKKTALEFAKMVCKTDPTTGDPLKEQGKYVYAPEKVNAITEAYAAELGILSTREKAVQQFKEKLDGCIQDQPELSLSFYDKKDVIPLLNKAEQIARFREKLRNTPEDQIQSTLDGVLEEKRHALAALMLKYTPNKELEGLATRVIESISGDDPDVHPSPGPNESNRKNPKVSRRSR